MNQRFCEYPGTGGNLCHNPVAVKAGDRFYCKKHAECVEVARKWISTEVVSAKKDS